MIRIIRNKNFSDWINVTVFGKLMDNCKTNARALHIAKKLQMDHKAKTGDVLYISQK